MTRSILIALVSTIISARAEDAARSSHLPGDFDEVRQCYMQRVDAVFPDAEKLHQLGRQAIFSPQEGDIKLENGSVVDRSCVRGKDATAKEKFIAAAARAIKDVEARSIACRERFGFNQISKIKEILSRSVFLCGTAPREYVASAIYGIEAEKRVPILGLHWKVVSGPAPVSKQYGYVIILNNQMDPRVEATQEDLNSFLFHEILHFNPTNNRKWHNEAAKYRSSGCEDSRYRDFIYLVQAACFPESSAGKAFFNRSNGAAYCPGLCESALSEVDEETKAEFKKYVGPALYLRPYSKNESKRICENIRSTGSDWIKNLSERSSK